MRAVRVGFDHFAHKHRLGESVGKILRRQVGLVIEDAVVVVLDSIADAVAGPPSPRTECVGTERIPVGDAARGDGFKRLGGVAWADEDAGPRRHHGAVLGESSPRRVDEIDFDVECVVHLRLLNEREQAQEPGKAGAGDVGVADADAGGDAVAAHSAPWIGPLLRGVVRQREPPLLEVIGAWGSPSSFPRLLDDGQQQGDE
jgi:hypothetical protein